jgi:calcineurin-like phosphoesterase family protein
MRKRARTATLTRGYSGPVAGSGGTRVLGGAVGLRLGILADPHLVPDDHATDGDMARYRSALRRCVREGVDGLALLGDLSWSGDAASLEAGLRLAARTGLVVWAVSGNHDLGEREDALAKAIRRVETKNVRLATPAGEVFGGEDVRVASPCVTSDNYGYTARSDERPDVSGWGEETVVLLSHYPMISFRERAEREGVYYGDNNLEEVARPLLGRTAPTVVINGHMHMRDDCAAEQVLQISCAALTQPAFDVTLLDLKAGRGRISVEVERIPVAPSPDVRLSALSPARLRWVFEEGTWRQAAPEKQATR